IIPAQLFLHQVETIGSVAVNFVRRHMDKRRFRTGGSYGLKQIQSADRIDIEIIKRPAGSQIMAGLRSRMNDCLWGNLANSLGNSCSVADIEFAVAKAGKFPFETFPIPPRVSLRPEKIAPHIVIQAMHLPALSREKCNHFAADQAA